MSYKAKNIALLLILSIYISSVLGSQTQLSIKNNSDEDWQWETDSKKIDENGNINQALVISFVDTKIYESTEFDINITEHATDQDSYVCFGLYPRSKINDLRNDANKSHRDQAVTACSDQYTNNPYGNIAKSGLPPMRQSEQYKLKYNAGVLLIETENDKEFKADFIVDVNEEYVPYIELYEPSDINVKQFAKKKSSTNSGFIAPDYWQWQNPSTNIDQINGIYEATTGTKGNLYVNLPAGIKPGSTWEINIVDHSTSGWVCIGVIPMSLIPQIQNNPSTSYYNQSSSICTDVTYYGQEKNIEGVIESRTNTIGQIFEITYNTGELLVSNEKYGGNTKVTITLDSSIVYTSWIEIYDNQSVQVGTSLNESEYTFQWYTPSIENGKYELGTASSTGKNGASLFLSSNVLTPNTKFNVEVKEHVESGWVCIGIIDQSLEEEIKNSAYNYFYSKSAVICTDVTFYNDYGNIDFQNSKDQMPKQEGSIDYTFYVTYKGNRLFFQDNIGKISYEYSLVEGNYIPYIEINGAQTVLIPQGSIQPSETPVIRETKPVQEDNQEEEQVFERIEGEQDIPEQEVQYQALWKTFSAYGDIDEENILVSSTVDDVKVVQAYSQIKFKPSFGISAVINYFDFGGYVCVGAISTAVQDQFKTNPDQSLLSHTISVCSNGKKFFEGEALSEEGELPSDWQGVFFHIHFYEKKISIMVGDYVGFFLLDETIQYFPYVEVSKQQVVSLGSYEELVPRLVPIQKYTSQWQTNSTGGQVLEDGTVVQNNIDSVTEAFVNSPLQPFTKYRVEIVSHDDLQTWICFGFYPEQGRDALLKDADSRKHSGSVSACTDDTYNDYFDNQSIEKTGSMPYRNASVGKQFDVFLLDNLVVIEGVDFEFYSTFRVNSQNSYLAWIEVKGVQAIKTSEFIRYRYILEGESALEENEINFEKQEEELAEQAEIEANLPDGSQETEVVADLKVFGNLSQAGEKYEKQITSGIDGQGIVLGNSQIKGEQIIWYVKINYHTNSAKIAFGVVEDQYVKNIVDGSIDHSDSEHLARISTDGTTGNGERIIKTEGTLAAGVLNVGKVYQFTYVAGKLLVSDLGGDFIAEFNLNEEAFYFFFIQIFGEVQIQISETIMDVDIVEEGSLGTKNPDEGEVIDSTSQGTQVVDNQEEHNDFGNVTASGDSSDAGDEYPEEDYQGQVQVYDFYGTLLKFKYVAETQKWFYKSKVGGAGTFISQYSLSSENIYWYVKINKFATNGKFVLGITQDSEENLDSITLTPTADISGNYNSIGISSEGISFDNFGTEILEEGTQTIGQNNKSSWYMFYFDAQEYKFYIYDLSGDYSVVFTLVKGQSYVPVMYLSEKVKVRVSTEAPDQFLEEITGILASFEQDQEIPTTDAQDVEDDNTDDDSEKTVEQIVENGQQQQEQQEQNNEQQNDGESQQQDSTNQQTNEEEEQQQEQEQNIDLEQAAEIIEEEGEQEIQYKDQWDHTQNSDRGEKIGDDICGDEAAPINFFVDEKLDGNVSWEYKVVKHQAEGFICFGVLPRQLYQTILELPDNFHYEQSISACTDGTFYNGPSGHNQIFIEGDIKLKQENSGVTYQITHYPNVIMIKEKNSDFVAEFKFPNDIELMPWFEIYGKHLITFNPHCDTEVPLLVEEERPSNQPKTEEEVVEEQVDQEDEQQQDGESDQNQNNNNENENQQDQDENNQEQENNDQEIEGEEDIFDENEEEEEEQQQQEENNDNTNTNEGNNDDIDNNNNEENNQNDGENNENTEENTNENTEENTEENTNENTEENTNENTEENTNENTEENTNENTNENSNENSNENNNNDGENIEEQIVEENQGNTEENDNQEEENTNTDENQEENTTQGGEDDIFNENEEEGNTDNTSNTQENNIDEGSAIVIIDDEEGNDGEESIEIDTEENNDSTGGNSGEVTNNEGNTQEGTSDDNNGDSQSGEVTENNDQDNGDITDEDTEEGQSGQVTNNEGNTDENNDGNNNEENTDTQEGQSGEVTDNNDQENGDITDENTEEGQSGEVTNNEGNTNENNEEEQNTNTEEGQSGEVINNEGNTEENNGSENNGEEENTNTEESQSGEIINNEGNTEENNGSENNGEEENTNTEESQSGEIINNEGNTEENNGSENNGEEENTNTEESQSGEIINNEGNTEENNGSENNNEEENTNTEEGQSGELINNEGQNNDDDLYGEEEEEEENNGDNTQEGGNDNTNPDDNNTNEGEENSNTGTEEQGENTNTGEEENQNTNEGQNDGNNETETGENTNTDEGTDNQDNTNENQGQEISGIVEDGEQQDNVYGDIDSDDGCIEIYSQCNYQGESAAICGESPFDFEHDIKSVKVPPGKCITLFHITCFHGYTSIISQDVECLDDVDGQFLLQFNIKLFNGEVSPTNEIQISDVKNVFDQYNKKQHLRGNLRKKKSLRNLVQMMSTTQLSQIYSKENDL